MGVVRDFFGKVGDYVSDAWNNFWGFFDEATDYIPGVAWVKDQIRAAIDLLIDEILDPFMEWVRDQIEKLVAEIRILKHNLKKTLARWLENDLFFLWFTTVSIVLIFHLPEVAAAFKNLKIVTLGKDLIDKMVTNVVKLIDVNKVIDLRLLDQILRVFWDDYRDLMAQWSMAVADLAAELGDGTGYIHAGFAAVRAIYHGYHAVAGLPPESAELAWYNDTAAFTKRLDDRFRRYAYDPGLIYVDIMDELLIPAAEKLRASNQEQVEQMRENYNRGLEIENGLKEMQQGFEDLIEWLPGEIEAQYRLWWDPFSEWLTERFDRIDQEIMPKLNSMVLAFEERVDYQNKINRAALDNLQRPDVIAATFWYLSDEAKQAYLDTMSGILIGDDKDARLDDDTYDRYLGGLSRLDAEFTITGFAALEFERQGVYHIRGERGVNIPSPFVGDY
jgi:hypothetical protein